MQQLNRRTEFKLDTTALALLLPLLALPFVTNNPFHVSLTHQVVIGLIAALGVYIMLRMDLLAFTVVCQKAFEFRSRSRIGRNCPRFFC